MSLTCTITNLPPFDESTLMKGDQFSYHSLKPIAYNLCNDFIEYIATR